MVSTGLADDMEDETMKCELCKTEDVTNGVAVCDLCEAEIAEVIEYFEGADECAIPYM